jgi:hypothetical protein
MTAVCTNFDYFAVIPGGSEEYASPWPLRLIDETGSTAGTAPRFGLEPTLTICDAAPPTNASPERPWVLRSRFTVNGGEQSGTFHVDRSLTSALRAGDVIHIAQPSGAVSGCPFCETSALWLQSARSPSCRSVAMSWHGSHQS